MPACFLVGALRQRNRQFLRAAATRGCPCARFERIRRHEADPDGCPSAGAEPLAASDLPVPEPGPADSPPPVGAWQAGNGGPAQGLHLPATEQPTPDPTK